mgnify:CR=1 FL=1
MALSQAKIRTLDRFEARSDDWRFGEFEAILEQEMGKRYANYQDAKMTIIEANKIGNWPKTVKRYILTNYIAFGNCPAEFTDILRGYLENMTSEEKKVWGLPPSKPDED